MKVLMVRVQFIVKVVFYFIKIIEVPYKLFSYCVLLKFCLYFKL